MKSKNLKRKKKAYVVVNKDTRRVCGAFVRSKDGHIEAKKYKKSLEKDSNEEFIIQ